MGVGCAAHFGLLAHFRRGTEQKQILAKENVSGTIGAAIPGKPRHGLPVPDAASVG
jgi:hypothetical protein